MYIPISALGSGSSFGFFMGIGMVMRSEMEGSEDNEKSTVVISINPETGNPSSDYVFRRHIIEEPVTTV